MMSPNFDMHFFITAAVTDTDSGQSTDSEESHDDHDSTMQLDSQGSSILT